MDRENFWLTNDQFAPLEPHLPTDTRGKPRADDRRVISGIIDVLRSGSCWVDAPSDYGPRNTLYNRFVCWATKGVWADIFHAMGSAGGPPEQVLIDSSAVRAHRCASGGKWGTHPGDRPLSRWANHENPCADDCFCRPIAFLLTGGQVADCTAADALLDQMPETEILHGDKGYDSDGVRRKIESKGAAPNVPPKANRRWKN
jgi:transposase